MPTAKKAAAERAAEALQFKASIAERLIEKKERVRILLNQFTPDNLERNFRQIIQPLLLSLDDTKEHSISILRELILKKKHKIELLKNDLESASPMAILQRGFAVITDKETDKLIKSAKKLNQGQMINIRFAKNSASAEIKET